MFAPHEGRLTAAGLFRTLTRFPINLLNGEPITACKDTTILQISEYFCCNYLEK